MTKRRRYEFQVGNYLLGVEAETQEEAYAEALREYGEPLKPISLLGLIRDIDVVTDSPLQVTDEGLAIRLGSSFWTVAELGENPEMEALVIRALVNDARRRGARVQSAENEGQHMVSITTSKGSYMRASHNEPTAYALTWLASFSDVPGK